VHNYGPFIFISTTREESQHIYEGVDILIQHGWRCDLRIGPLTPYSVEMIYCDPTLYFVVLDLSAYYAWRSDDKFLINRRPFMGVEFWLPCSDEHVISTIEMYEEIGDRVRIK
jgi:hypothetical protein